MIGLTHSLRWSARVAVFGASVLTLPLGAQNAATQGWNPQQILRTETYVKPPADVERIIMAPRTDISFTTPSPDRKWFLRTPGADRGDIDDIRQVAHQPRRPADRHEGESRAHADDEHASRARRSSIRARMATKTIETPKGATISAQTWSPTGTQVAYIANFDDASHIFVADVATGKSTQITKTPLLATLVTTLDWTADGKSIVTVLVPDGRGAAPMHGKNGVEDGPQVRLTESRALPQVIHPSLLEDPHDKAHAQVLHDRPARADRREVEDREEDRRAGDDPRGRCVARRPVLPRDADDRAVLVHRAGVELRLGAGVVGRERQGVATLNKTPLREGERGGRRPTRRARRSRRRSSRRVGHGQAQHPVESGGPGPRVPAVGVRAARAQAARGAGWWSRRPWCAGGGRGAQRRASAADERSLHELAAAVRTDRHEGDLRGQRPSDERRVQRRRQDDVRGRQRRGVRDSHR